MTQCNYCLHKQRKKNWRRDKIKVKRSHDPLASFKDGVRFVDKETNEFLVWYARLPKSCKC